MLKPGGVVMNGRIGNGVIAEVIALIIVSDEWNPIAAIRHGDTRFGTREGNFAKCKSRVAIYWQKFGAP